MNRVYYIDVLETKPAPVIKIMNVDIIVDFDRKPLDYVEPEPQEEKVPEPVVNNYMEEPEYDTIRFPGRNS